MHSYKQEKKKLKAKQTSDHSSDVDIIKKLPGYAAILQRPTNQAISMTAPTPIMRRNKKRTKRLRLITMNSIL